MQRWGSVRLPLAVAVSVAAHGVLRSCSFALPWAASHHTNAAGAADVGADAGARRIGLRVAGLRGSALSKPCLLAAACACAAVGASAGSLRRRRRAQPAAVARRAFAEPGAGGAIETFLFKGPVDASALAIKCAPLANFFDLECVTFFCLGVDPAAIASVAGGALGLHGVCPVYIADCKGIVGWDAAIGANVEMLDASLGGSGGPGVVVAAFRGGCHQPSSLDEGEQGQLPSGRALHMVVRSRGKPNNPTSGVVYGGIAKACYRLEHSGDLVKVAQFAVSTPFAVLSTFERRAAGEAASSSVKLLPPVAYPPIAAGYFSCPSRGVNKYGKDGVEPAAFAEHGLAGVPLFGMFAEALGPPADGAPLACVPELTEWTSILDADPRPGLQLHAAASVLALYGK